MTVYPEQVIRQILVDDTGVAAIVGTRVYPHSVPKGEDLPAIVYVLEESEPLPHLNGRSSQSDEFDLICLGTTYGAVKELAEAVRAAVAHFSGDVTPSGASTMTVQMLTHLRSDDVDLVPRDGSDVAPAAVSVRVRMRSIAS